MEENYQKFKGAGQKSNDEKALAIIQLIPLHLKTKT